MLSWWSGLANENAGGEVNSGGHGDRGMLRRGPGSPVGLPRARSRPGGPQDLRVLTDESVPPAPRCLGCALLVSEGQPSLLSLCYWGIMDIKHIIMTVFKCTVQQHLRHSHGCVTITTAISNTFSSSQTETVPPNTEPIPSQAPGTHHSASCLHGFDSLGTSC